jgi:hypothetical protein
MNKRNEILREILRDKELLEKYSIKEKEIEQITTSAPYTNILIEVLAIIINENDNKRSDRQIYSTIKNIHNI